MKQFPFKVLILCILLPPVAHVVSVHGLEIYLQKHELSRVSGILINDMDALLQGRYTVKEEVTRNIDNYLRQWWLTRLGVKLDLLVKTKQGRILYPPSLAFEARNQSEEGQIDYMEVAARNYQILQKGLDLSLSIRVPYGGLLSSSILGFYILVAILVLQHYIRKGVRAAQQEEAVREKHLQELSRSLQEAGARLDQIRAREEQYARKIETLKKEKTELTKDVDSLLEEMEKLEQGLQAEKDLKQRIESEMDLLREELSTIREARKGGKRKDKKLESARKRFRILYKNVTFTDRAIEGFLALQEDFQLKAEELISRLNQGGAEVQVRRKVFGRGGKKDILESEFSYSGRLYFQRNHKGGVTVLAIGTKNTQNKDLAYLESVG